MNEKEIKSLQTIRAMMVIDSIFVAGIGAYLVFYSQQQWLGFFLFMILSSLATVFSTCSQLLKGKQV